MSMASHTQPEMRGKIQYGDDATAHMAASGTGLPAWEVTVTVGVVANGRLRSSAQQGSKQVSIRRGY